MSKEIMELEEIKNGTRIEHMQISQEDIASYAEHELKKFPEDNCHIAACNYAKEAKVKTNLVEVPHKFTCGTDGHKVKSIQVTVEIPDNFVLQAHTRFSESWADNAIQNLIGDMRGHLENIE